MCKSYNFDYVPPNNSKSLQNPSKITPKNYKSLKNEDINDVSNLQCEFCLKIFSRRDNVTKHYKICKKKKKETVELGIILEKRLKKRKKVICY